jgi:hypothetical protein
LCTGAVSDVIENEVGGVALFINSDAGDIDPITSILCGCQSNGDCSFTGAPIIAKAVQQVDICKVVDMLARSELR